MGLGKARKAAAEPWKLRLYETPADDFATAQQLMDVIVDITGQKSGRLGGKIQPRICTSCGHWGHSREYCAYWSHLYEDKIGLPPSKFSKHLPHDPARGWRRPESREECASDEEWEWVCTLKRINERVEEGRRLGKGCTSGREVRCAGDIDLHCACNGCVEWRKWVRDEA